MTDPVCERAVDHTEWTDGDFALDTCDRVYQANIHRPGGAYTIATWLTFGSDRAAARIGEECRDGRECWCPEPHVPLRRVTWQVTEDVGDDGA